jgi:hypothetical protein
MHRKPILVVLPPNQPFECAQALFDAPVPSFVLKIQAAVSAPPAAKMRKLPHRAGTVLRYPTSGTPSYASRGCTDEAGYTRQARTKKMALPIVRLGDKTSHGGVVITASAIHTIEGVGIARVGDQVSCPKPVTARTKLSKEQQRIRSADEWWPCMAISARVGAPLSRVCPRQRTDSQLTSDSMRST